jgi:O-acetyl-ADP-ribose deacetylase (regulator of RNase III)
VWNGGQHGEDALLASCYKTALGLAQQVGLATIAFPAISCGVYHFPVEQAAKIAVQTICRTLPACPAITKVLLVAFSPAIEAALARAVRESV